MNPKKNPTPESTPRRPAERTQPVTPPGKAKREAAKLHEERDRLEAQPRVDETSVRDTLL